MATRPVSGDGSFPFGGMLHCCTSLNEPANPYLTLHDHCRESFWVLLYESMSEYESNNPDGIPEKICVSKEASDFLSLRKDQELFGTIIQPDSILREWEAVVQ